MKVNIDKRLLCVSQLLRDGSFIADVGTDHAYLPIHMIACRSSSAAVATDINRGPTERAKENVARFGMSEKIDVLLTDGLHGVELYNIDSVVIAGMGGDSIVSILDEAPFVRDRRLRLVLQPMTRSDVLRRYLTENFYEITDEKNVRDGGKIYEVLAAEYRGNGYFIPKYSEAELIVGRRDVNEFDSLFLEFVSLKLKKAERKLDGIFSSVLPDRTEIEFESNLCREFREMLKKSE